MRRIILMVIRLLWKVPYYFYLIWKCGKDEKIGLEEAYARVKKVTKAANHAGRVKIETYGIENIPKQNGFMFFPNHQGLFDVLVFWTLVRFLFLLLLKKRQAILFY